MSTLTQKEIDTIKELSKKPNLNIEGCGHTYCYYGVQHDKEDWSDEMKSDVETLETIIKKILPSLSSFSNFTGDSPNRIRCQSHYDSSFVGVFYIPLKEIIDDFNKGL
jgi:hypothetical protein